MLWMAICDDEPSMLGHLEKEMYALKEKHQLDLKIEVFREGEEILKCMEIGHRYDIIFMDIEMDGLNGIETAVKIREMDLSAQLIYVTSHRNYMLDTFQVAPVGFVEKTEMDKLEAVFLNALRYVINQDSYYAFEYKKTHYKIPKKDIMYVTSHRRELEIMCADGTYRKYGKISEIEAELSGQNSQFYRIHRCHVANLRHVKRWGMVHLTMNNGTPLSIGKTYREKMGRVFRDF